ncbi:MAG: HEPN domain-containing protein [Desulfuromonadaceae bacterium]|nr:HEPN domain-containing protein [Desulfuromonadaceae bacterium]
MNDALLSDDPIAFLIQRGNDSLKSAEALVELDLILDGLSRAYYAALHHARALLFSRLSAFGHRENVIEAVERIKKNLK